MDLSRSGSLIILMLIFYSGAQGRQNVPAKCPVDEPAANVLEIFRSLGANSCFLGIVLKYPFVMQLVLRRNGVQVELLDSSIPAADLCEGVERAVAEELIEAAGNNEDVFQIARRKISSWEHLKM